MRKNGVPVTLSKEACEYISKSMNLLGGKNMWYCVQNTIIYLKQKYSNLQKDQVKSFILEKYNIILFNSEEASNFEEIFNEAWERIYLKTKKTIYYNNNQKSAISFEGFLNNTNINFKLQELQDKIKNLANQTYNIQKDIEMICSIVDKK